LNNAANDFNTVNVGSARNVTLRDSNAVGLGTLTLSGTLDVTATGAIPDANGAANNITASTATLIGSGIGTAADPIETNVGTLNASSSAAGIFIAQTGPLVLNTVTAVAGNIAISNTAGDMTINTVTATTGGVNLTALSGSILDGNGVATNVTAAANSTLSANVGVMGIEADPIEVTIAGGTLGVAATNQLSNISVTINGAVSPGNTLTVLNTPPGQVLFNGNRLFPIAPVAPTQSGVSSSSNGQFVQNSFQGREATPVGGVAPTILIATPSLVIRVAQELGPIGIATESASGDEDSFSDRQSSAVDSKAGEEDPGSSFPSLSGPRSDQRLNTADHDREQFVQDDLVVAQHDSMDSPRVQSTPTQTVPTTAAATGLEDVLFEYGSWRLRDEAVHALISLADWLKANSTKTIVIEGHCDERGTVAYNLALGELRAKAVRKLLIELGVNPRRLVAMSYGKERPFCREPHEACYQQNRRGHLIVKEHESARRLRQAQ
jgi:outer membrane protein OmpA-like peptidoglycan-associated protein